MSAQLKPETKIASEKTVITRIELEAEFNQKFKDKKFTPDQRLYNLFLLAVKRGALKVVQETWQDVIMPALQRNDKEWSVVKERNLGNPLALAVIYKQTETLDFLFNDYNNGNALYILTSSWQFGKNYEGIDDLFRVALKAGSFPMYLYIFELGKQEMFKFNRRGADCSDDMLRPYFGSHIHGALRYAALKRPEFFKLIFEHAKTFFSSLESYEYVIQGVVDAVIRVANKASSKEICSMLSTLEAKDIVAIIHRLKEITKQKLKTRIEEIVGLLQSHVGALHTTIATAPEELKSATEQEVVKKTESHDSIDTTAPAVHVSVSAGDVRTEDKPSGPPILSQFSQLTLASDSDAPQEKMKVLPS